MKRTGPFLFLLSSLSVLSGYLLSKATLIGRTGIQLFYKEYRFLRTWWKGAAAVFLVLLVLFAAQGKAQEKLPPSKARMVHIGAIVLALIGLFFTYLDFRHTLSHRLLGERFHLGAYLFWIGWVLVSLFTCFAKAPLPLQMYPPHPRYKPKFQNIFAGKKIAPAYRSMEPKKPFQLSDVLKRIEAAIAPYPKAAMFELYERGYTTLFEQLISCIISIRTLDETTIPVSEKLFAVARTPQALLQLSPQQLETLLYGSTFPGQKAYTMLGVARAAVANGGELPADFDQLTALKGVGPKCANLALGVASGQAGISVDVHVHRVVNRWGYIQTAQPEQTMLQLQEKVPPKRWIDINRLLMPFGKHICTGRAPRCSTCPVLVYCRQVGVTTHR